MKNKHHQITCYCSAYHFPHRLSGGDCNGSEWAESYKIIYGEYCSSCNSLNDNQCDVANGAEDVSQCEAAKFYLHYCNTEKLPIDIDEYMENKLKDQYG